MKIGILGGSFDPIHNGHIAMAHAAMVQLGLDEVIFIPAHRNPLKEKGPHSSARDRLEMVRLAIANEPKFAVSDQEIYRKGPSYTIDTLDELHAVRPADYWLIMGIDSVIRFYEWRNYRRLLKLARIACIYRGSEPSTELWERVQPEIRPFVDQIELDRIHISSTDIRLRLQQRQTVRGLMPEPVETFIQRNGLYKLK
jgi:nicotinate-nucleotide adenylyltransferase